MSQRYLTFTKSEKPGYQKGLETSERNKILQKDVEASCFVAFHLSIFSSQFNIPTHTSPWWSIAFHSYSSIPLINNQHGKFLKFPKTPGNPLRLFPTSQSTNSLSDANNVCLQNSRPHSSLSVPSLLYSTECLFSASKQKRRPLPAFSFLRVQSRNWTRQRCWLLAQVVWTKMESGWRAVCRLATRSWFLRYVPGLVPVTDVWREGS